MAGLQPLHAAGRTALLLAAAWLAGCATAPGPDAQISGTVISRERLYVPPDALFEAALVDVTREGYPPRVLGRQRIDPAGPLPYMLRIPYRQADVHAQGRYEVRAAVMQQGRLLLDTPRLHPVLIDPAFRHVDVILARVPALQATAAASVPLRQTYWKLVEVVDDAPVDAPAEGQAAAHLVLQRDAGRVSGSGGCNRFVGQYVQEGGQLRLSRMSASLRLCLAGGGSEPAFFQRLGAVAYYRQQGRTLELRGEDGTPLLRFVAEEWGAPRPEDDEPPMQPQ